MNLNLLESLKVIKILRYNVKSKLSTMLLTIQILDKKGILTLYFTNLNINPDIFTFSYKNNLLHL